MRCLFQSFNMKKYLIKCLLIFFIVINLASSNLKAQNSGLYEWTKEDYDDALAFTTQVVIGIIFHEIGHLVIDEFNVPNFTSEEDLADSFMAWHLIHIPSDYDNYAEYEKNSKESHAVIQAMSDYYYQNLLDMDYSNEFANHATSNKRFFNIACFMKGANPNVFNSYFNKRDLIFNNENKRLIESLDKLCNYNYKQMFKAWWNIFQNDWETDLSKYKQKISLNFKKTEDEMLNDFKLIAKDKINSFLQKMQIILYENYKINFLSCKDMFPKNYINAYYNGRNNQIIFCYELVDEILTTKYNVILLKNSL